MSDPHGKADLLLDAVVTVAKPEAGKQHVKIVWRMRRADGSEIGTVAQENDVPAGLLERLLGRRRLYCGFGGAGRHHAADRPRRSRKRLEILEPAASGTAVEDRRTVVRTGRGLLHYRCTKPRGSARRRGWLAPL